MRIVVAPQEFKGTLTATEAARAMALGVRDALPEAAVVEAPMSDGGAGVVDALLAALGGDRLEADVHDPLMRPVRAAWAMLPDGSAAIEMAAASGLVLLRPAEHDPLVATTYGTGELIRAALDRKATTVLVGVGGSATVDAGAGAMQALGARLLDAAGGELPPGGAALARLARIELSERDPRLARTAVRVLSDVLNTLCGPQGAAAVFGPQKGASSDDVRVLDAALRRFAAIALRDTGVDTLALIGGGAAGGLSAGLAAVAGAAVERGFDVVAEMTGLRAKIALCDGVITGEGRLDAQTAFGKTAAGVAAIAREERRPVTAIAGSIDGDAGAPYDAAISLVELAGSPEAAMRDAAGTLRRAAAVAAQRIVRRQRRRR